MTTTDPTAPATPGETANVRELADELIRNLPKVRKDFLRMLDAIMKASGDDDPTAVLKRMFYAFLIEHDHETLAATAAIAVQALVEQAKGARATDPAPATPPEHQPGARYALPAEPPASVTELWDCDGDKWDRYVRGGWSADDGESMWEWRELVAVYGPLSTTPPAEPEPDENGGPYFVTATDSPPRPPASDYARCRWCSEAIANRAGRWEHLGEPCAGSPVEPLPASTTAVDPPAGAVWP